MNGRAVPTEPGAPTAASTAVRPFRVLGLQQVAIGGTSKQGLRALWVDQLGLEVTGQFRSERENVDEDIAASGRARSRSRST